MGRPPGIGPFLDAVHACPVMTIRTEAVTLTIPAGRNQPMNFSSSPSQETTPTTLHTVYAASSDKVLAQALFDDGGRYRGGTIPYTDRYSPSQVEQRSAKTPSQPFGHGNSIPLQQLIRVLDRYTSDYWDNPEHKLASAASTG